MILDTSTSLPICDVSDCLLQATHMETQAISLIERTYPCCDKHCTCGWTEEGGEG